MAIHSLRDQSRPDTLKNQIRASQSLARRIYLGLLAAGALWIVTLFVGPLLFLNADGLVVQEKEVVSPAFPAQVAAVNVRPGDHVGVGQTICTVVSTQMLDLISDLTTR